jgi:uncharacterized damage-inducible protein DinB
MEMTAFFKDLYHYNHARNAELIGYLVQQDIPVPEKALTLLSHTLNAHEIWNCRIAGAVPTHGVWEIRKLSQLLEADRENTEASLKLLESADLSQEISYTTSQGDPFVSSVRDILFHVINHSTYHRGQIMTALKDAGIAPLVTDYIFYRRNLVL